jgi:hypothetical protein
VTVSQAEATNPALTALIDQALASGRIRKVGAIAARVNVRTRHHTQYDGSTLRRWARTGQVPKQPQIRQAVAAVFTELLNQPVSESDVWPSLRYTRAPTPVRSPHVLGDAIEKEVLSPVHRRTFIVSSVALGLSAHPTVALEAPRRVGKADVRRIQDAVRELHAADDKYGGDQLCELAIGQFHQIRRMLRDASYSEPVGRQLRSAAGHMAEHAGWLLFDASRHAEARDFYNEALAAARLAQDESLSVLVLASMGLQSTYLGAAREARDLLVHAQESESVPAFGRLRSVLLGREATALAAMGDAVGARRALTRARRALERGGNAEDPDWVSFHSPAELAVCESICRANLDDPAGAKAQLYAALDMQDTSYVRNRALYTTWLAELELAGADAERASSLAGEALVLAAEIRSTRVVEHIGRFRRAVDRHRHVPAVGDFAERCDVFLQARLRTAG